MNALIPFQFENKSIRVVTDEHGEPLFVGRDVALALGYADPTTAMRSHCRGVQKLHPIPDALGRAQDARVLTEPDVLRMIVNSTLPAAEAFERWVFEEVLPTIRKTGSYAIHSSSLFGDTVDALRLAPLAVKAAMALGLDKNAAAISANQLVIKVTGQNLLQDFGAIHLKAENQESLFYTPTELGKRTGTSARGMNLLLAEAGFQMKRGEHWEVTDIGKDFSRIFDTGKKHGSGVPVQQIKWSAEVLPVLGQGGGE